ncbi:MAG TPA: hypothetical protein VK986_23275 [Tepidisphaeraceae bacterium]|nr:hypothetical protein [Tepidisphaeraceae bacterium]
MAAPQPAKPATKPAPVAAKPAPKPVAKAPAKPAKPTGPLKPLQSFDHEIELATAAFSPCGKYLVAAGTDATLYRYDTEKWERTELKGHNAWLSAIAFHPTDGRLFSLDSWGRICAWNYADDSPKPLWTREDAHKGWAKHLALSPDGKLLATCGADKHVRLWSATDGSPLATLAREKDKPAHDSVAFTLAFHPDGSSLVSGDLKGQIHEWALPGGEYKRTLDAKSLFLHPDNINDVGGVRRLVFFDAGKSLAACGANPATAGFVTAKPVVLLFDWSTGKQTGQLQPPDVTAQDGFAFDAAQHPAGPLMVAASGSQGRGAFWYWKPGDPAPILVDRLQLHCRSISLHPDGKRLAMIRYGAGGGNGKKLDKEGMYAGNPCTLKVFEFTPPATA